MAQNWWREPDMGVMSCPVPAGEQQGCAAMRMWRSACTALAVPDLEGAWRQLAAASPPDSLWHSLRNCVAYQAGVWQNLLNKGIADVIQPAAFKLAIVLRHTPSKVTVQLLSELLRLHPQALDLTSYILALLTDDEPLCCEGCSSNESSSNSESSESVEEEEEEEEQEQLPIMESDNEAEAVPVPNDPTTLFCENIPHPDSPNNPGQPDSATADSEEAPKPDSASGVEPDSAEPDSAAPPDLEGAVEEPAPTSPTPTDDIPLRDLQLFGDCELAVLAASREEYDAHAKLVRAEYSKLTQDNYVELRIKVLNQFAQIPKLFHTAEFECLEAAARENIEREICTLREHLLTGRGD